MDPAEAPLSALLATAPLLSRPELAHDRFSAWAATVAPGSGLADALAVPLVARLLEAIADHSPYLWRLATQDHARLERLMAAPPGPALDTCLAGLNEATRGSTTDLAQALRRAKGEVALLVALADLGGVWEVAQVTEALTRFADRAVAAGLRALLRDAHAAGKLRLADRDNPEQDCGMVVLALGKQGSRELNYSSDIDIMVFFDPATRALPNGAAPAPFYVRLTQNLARLLQERTADGYVLRVDLRLRPDPGSTAVAIGLPSAFGYYERYGQNWERAALIKARPVAGDRSLGTAFLNDLAPFIWRKYFDFAAIADIHAMKRQIHAVRGHAAIAVAGHDVKLGRGGIREIEFFVQTQQLIFGGRRPTLRGAQILPMLRELHRDGWIGADAVEDLSSAYRFLRGIEHRLQMVNDEQTQRLPADPDALARFAAFAGYASAAGFADAFVARAEDVERHYARLFEHAPGLAADTGSLVFTGVEDDPETLDTLTRMGFKRAPEAADAVRGWHFGRRAAVQSPRAREVLTELVPSLLEAFARSGDPDGALAAFDRALARMPAAVELLSMLRSNAALLALFGDILGMAPRLAATVATRPHVLDAAIDPALLASSGDPALLARRVAAVLDPGLPTEEFLDRARELAQEESFLIGVRLLGGIDDPQRTAEAYSDLAALVVQAVLAHCTAVFERDHGSVRGGACVVVAMGKLGSREMTAGSDLDLILIYDFDADRPDSAGPRRLDAPHYYARLTQRLIAALTVATRRGRLYEVDLRLRPSGGQGPLATQLRSFARYQAQEADTWEHMALTRARVIAGDAGLGARVVATIAAVLTTPRDGAVVRQKIRSMRALIAKEKGEGDPWNFKLTPGGLLDIEFVAQGLVLCFASEHPSLKGTATGAILEEAARLHLLDGATAATLIGAHRLYSGLAQIIRLAVEGRFDPAQMGIGLRRRMERAADVPDFAVLESELGTTARDVRAAFERFVSPQG